MADITNITVNGQNYTIKDANAIPSSEKGANNGVATLGSDGKVPSNQLPSFVDDVIEGYYYNGKFYTTSAHTTEIKGEGGKIYVDLATEKTYRYSGSAYVEISNGGSVVSATAEYDSGIKLADITIDGSTKSIYAPNAASVNDGKLTIQKNGVNVQTFSANQSTNVTANITVPTKISDLTDDSGHYTKPSGGIPKTDLASGIQTSLGLADTALQSHQDISGKENTSNKVTSISANPTDAQYPSAKAVKSFVEGKGYKTTDNNTTYTFADGTNGFTVTPSDGSAQTVKVTPSIANNITGSGTNGYLAKFNGANTITDGVALGSDTTKYLRNDGTWATPSDTHGSLNGSYDSSTSTLTLSIS